MSVHTILIISYHFIVLHILLNIVITLKSQNLESNKVIIIILLPPHLLSILKLWFNFIFGLNFIFFCFKLIIHYHTQKPTYLSSMGNCLSRKAEMPTSVVDSGDSPFFTCPPSPLSTAPLPPPPLLHPAPKLTQPPKGIMWSLTWSKCYQNPPLLDPNTYTCTSNYCWKQLQTHRAP